MRRWLGCRRSRQGSRAGSRGWTVWVLALMVMLVAGAIDGARAQEGASLENLEGSQAQGRRLGMRVDDLYFDDESRLVAQITLANLGTEVINRLEASIIVLNQCEVPEEGVEVELERQLQTCRFVTYNEFTATGLGLEPGQVTSGTFDFGIVPRVELENWYVPWYIKVE